MYFGTYKITISDYIDGDETLTVNSYQEVLKLVCGVLPIKHHDAKLLVYEHKTSIICDCNTVITVVPCM